MRPRCKESKILQWRTNTPHPHNSCLCKPTYSPSPPNTNRVKGGFSQPAWSAHQVHGGAAWRMWLNKQLRWRLSKVLDLCLCGLQEREGAREQEKERVQEGKRERLSQSICIKVMGQCVTWQCKQILTQPCLSEEAGRGGGGNGGKGELSQSPMCSPFPHSLQSHPSVSMEETSLFLLTCFS